MFEVRRILLEPLSQPCEAGDSIKPGAERGFASATLGSFQIMVPAREAGVSIKPRVERGFASATLGSFQIMVPAREAGDSEREPTSMLVAC
jgi:hypothetical protein